MAVLDVYAKLKIKIFIWEQVLGTRRPFGHLGKPKISPGHNGPHSGNNVIPELRWNRVKWLALSDLDKLMVVIWLSMKHIRGGH